MELLYLPTAAAPWSPPPKRRGLASQLSLSQERQDTLEDLKDHTWENDFTPCHPDTKVSGEAYYRPDS